MKRQPSAAEDVVAAQSAEQYRARWAISLLLACVVLDGAGVLAGLAPRLPLDANAMDLLQLVAFVATGSVWLLWLQQAYRNLRLVGTRRSRFSSGWAVAFWLIPFINLVRPYEIVKELWQRSEARNDRDSFDGLPAPAFIPWWWATCVLSGLGRLHATLTVEAQAANSAAGLTNVAVLEDALGVVAAVLAIRLVRGITGLQQLFQTQRVV